MPASIASRQSSPSARARTSNDRGSEPSSSLDLYLADGADFELLTAEAEMKALTAMLALRRERWRVLLAAPWLPRVEAFVMSAEADGGRSEAPLALLRRTFAARGTPPPADLALAVDALDVDGTFGDRLGRAVDDSEDGGDPSTPRELGRRLHAARNDFACRNLRLVVFLAARFPDEPMPLSDRVQEGNLGLISAINRFDPARGCRFSTYATWWIRFSISRALVDRGRCVRVPVHVHGVFANARRAERRLRRRVGREPSLGEIALEVGVPVERVAEAREAVGARIFPLLAVGEDGAVVPEALVGGLELVDDQSLDEHRRLVLARRAVAQLSPLERDIIDGRFGLSGTPPMTLTLLGERHALSGERIRQLQVRALRKLRRAVESSRLGVLAFVTP